MKSFAEIPSIDPPAGLVTTGQVPAYLAEMALEHGPMFTWDVEWRPGERVSLLFMVGPAANRFVMQTHREHFSHDLGWTPIVGEWMGKGLLNMDVPDWTLHRRMMNPAFTSAYVAAYLPIMQRVIATRTRDWAERGEVDLYWEARQITFDVAATALAGLRPGPVATRLRGLFYSLVAGPDPKEETNEQFAERWPKIIAELDDALLPLIAERRQQAKRPGVDGAPVDVLGMIVDARDDQGQPLDDRQVLAHVKVLLVAGHETTTSLSTWTLYLLSLHPAYRDRVLAELEAATGSLDTPLSYETIRGLKVLDDVVREAGRLYSPVITVPRGVVKDFEFAGFHVPAGVSLRLALAGCHRLPSIFQNPDAFEPDRFEPPRDEDKRTPYALVTFGGGPRICIGMGFAQEEIKAMVLQVLRRYRLEIVDPSSVVHAGWLTGFLPNGCRAKVTAIGPA